MQATRSDHLDVRCLAYPSSFLRSGGGVFRCRSAGGQASGRAPTGAGAARRRSSGRLLATRCSPCRALLVGAARPADLGDHQMVVGAGGHLRQMRDRQHLIVGPGCFIRRPTVSATAPPTPESTSSKISVPAPGRAQLAGGDGDRQRDARQLAARRPPCPGPRRAGMAGDENSADFRAAGRGLPPRPGRFEAAALHAQFAWPASPRQAGRGWRAPTRLLGFGLS